jgi:molybdopterin synthase catalytic subunit
MKVHVLFFGMLKEVAGRSSELFELPEDSSAQSLLAILMEKYPGIRESLASIAIAVNQHYRPPDTKLRDGDEIALLPPVSGGAGADDASTKPSTSHAAITHQVIQVQRIVDSLKRGEDGATLFFEGIVRNQTRSRKTLFLDYEAYDDMALAQMESLATQALGQFQIRDLVLVHRLGRIEIGETSVLIAVVSAHRAAAFEACRWLIDTLKRTVPIWKKEYFKDGAVWADGEPFPPEIPRANY